MVTSSRVVGPSAHKLCPGQRMHSRDNQGQHTQGSNAGYKDFASWSAQYNSVGQPQAAHQSKRQKVSRLDGHDNGWQAVASCNFPLWLIPWLDWHAG